VGGGPDVRRDLAGLRVRRVRDRRVRPPDRRLAGLDFAAQRSGARSRRSTIDRSRSRSGWCITATAAYLSIRYTERLAEAGIEPSVGSTGDSYDNALAESVIGLSKTEEIHRRGPWKGVEDVEFATLEWVAWYNTSRLLEPIGYVSPNEFERAYYDRQPAPAELAALT
jgi:transposase InsO family protein